MDIKTSFPFQLVVVSTAGLFVIILLNCFACFGISHPAAVAFQGEWWSVWYPHYVVWFGFFILGGVAWLIET